MNDFDPTSKISRRAPVKNSASRIVSMRKEPSQIPETIDKVTLSHKPKPLAETTKAKASGEIRQQLVSKFREILENGTYQVKANEIADKMVQKIREQKNRMII